MSISRRPVHAIVHLDSRNREHLLLHTIASTAEGAKRKWIEADTLNVDPERTFKKRIKFGSFRYAKLRITEVDARDGS